jgi:hypothetical protein
MYNQQRCVYHRKINLRCCVVLCAAWLDCVMCHAYSPSHCIARCLCRAGFEDCASSNKAQASSTASGCGLCTSYATAGRQLQSDGIPCGAGSSPVAAAGAVGTAAGYWLCWLLSICSTASVDSLRGASSLWTHTAATVVVVGRQQQPISSSGCRRCRSGFGESLPKTVYWKVLQQPCLCGLKVCLSRPSGWVFPTTDVPTPSAGQWLGKGVTMLSASLIVPEVCIHAASASTFSVVWEGGPSLAMHGGDFSDGVHSHFALSCLHPS